MDIQAANPVWANAENTAINLTLVTSDNVKAAMLVPTDTIPFTASQNDIEEHGQQIFALAVAGTFGAISPYIPQE